jgi:hypothetical protein
MIKIMRHIGPTKTFFRATILLLCLTLAPAVFAQNKAKKNNVIRLGETTIVGRVQKPNAFFINTRQALVYKSAEIQESFVGEITKAVKTGPF